MAKKNIRNSPPKDPAEAYVYHLRKTKKTPYTAPDWLDVGEAFEAGMRHADKRRRGIERHR